jgi:hypothetical protein
MIFLQSKLSDFSESLYSLLFLGLILGAIYFALKKFNKTK